MKRGNSDYDAFPSHEADPQRNAIGQSAEMSPLVPIYAFSDIL